MSADRVNRRDLIVTCASEFFKEQGYNATSVRQIADQVGVTEAALYYHFKGGKRELLEAVFECEMPDFARVVETCNHAESFSELMQCLLKQLEATGRRAMERMRWLIAEFPHLSPEERSFLQDTHIKFQQSLAHAVRRFFKDDEEAHRVAIILDSMFIGYGQIFWSLDMESRVSVSAEQMIETFLAIVQVE